MHYFDIQFTLDCFVANVRPLVPTPLICVRLGSISAVLTEGENLQHGGLRQCTHQRRLSCWTGLLVGDEGGRIRTSLANTDAHIPLSFFCVCRTLLKDAFAFKGKSTRSLGSHESMDNCPVGEGFFDRYFAKFVEIR